MNSYFNSERVKQAGGLTDKLREAGLGHVELSLLKALGRKMGRKTDIATGEVENGCRASLEALERETLLERKAIGNALGRLIDKGFITKTYDRSRVTELTREGQRRKARGLSLVCPEKYNYQRQPMGAQRKDGSAQGQWKHCVYHLVLQVWDSVVFDSRKVRVAPAAPVSAEDQQVIDSMDLPVATPATAIATVTGKQLDEVFGHIKHYFGDHPTIAAQSEKDAVRSMSHTCKELAKRAFALGELRYAHDFLLWLIQRREAECMRLTDKVAKLGGSFGLPKTIADLWDEFVPERHDDYSQDGSKDDSNDQANDDQENGGPAFPEADDALTTPTPAAKTKFATLGHDFDDEEDEPVEEAKQETPSFTHQREMLVKALQTETDLLSRPVDRVTVSLDPLRSQVGSWLGNVSYNGQITHERVSSVLLKVTLAWNAARYITEYAEQFIQDGWIDSNYAPVIDPAVQAQIEAEERATAELERELARKKQEEAAEVQRVRDKKIAEAQRKEAAEAEKAAEAAREVMTEERYCREELMREMNEDGTFTYGPSMPDRIRILRDYLTKAFPHTLTITSASESMIRGECKPSLLEAMKSDPTGFYNNGLAAEEERELVAVA